jgi:hypothetical protein
MVWEDAVPFSKVANDLAQRFKYLEQLRERSEGEMAKRISARDVGKSLGIEVGTSDAIAQYLVSKGLAKYSATGVPGGLISITSEGIEALDWTVAHPREPSDPFPAFHIMFLEDTSPSITGAARGAQPSARKPSAKKAPESLSDYWTKIKGIIGR